jgi:hypothetical protein
VNTIQREQYGVTVHLFISTGRSPDKITFMSQIFTDNHKTGYQGLSSLFPFRSVSSSTFIIILRRSSFSHSFSIRSSCLRVVSPYHAYLHPKAEASCSSLCYTENILVTFFRTFGRERPPTYSIFLLLLKIPNCKLGSNFQYQHYYIFITIIMIIIKCTNK